jgi:hypothetical protein
VRLNGIVYEALSLASIGAARVTSTTRRSTSGLRGGRFVIEMTPVRAGGGTKQDIVALGAVGSRRGSRFPIFRYEIRRWRDGYIPDVAEAVEPTARQERPPTSPSGWLTWRPRFPRPCGAATS